MASIVAPDGTTYSDGPYTGVCVRQKKLVPFTGTVWMDDLGRILASGPCSSCGTQITTTLYAV